jgi:Tfp pilus assembly protein PilN
MPQADFLPERVRQQRQRRQRLTRQAYLVLACIAALGLLGWLRQGRVQQARAELTDQRARMQEAESRIARIPRLERELADLRIKQQIDRELGSRTDTTAVLAELCRLMPETMSMISLELKPVEIRRKIMPSNRGRSGGRAVSADRAGRPATKIERRLQLVLTGMASSDVDVANFIGQLSASPLFEDVNIGYTKTINHQDRSARQFQASCYLIR